MEMLGLSFANPSSSQDALVIADIGSYPEVRMRLNPWRNGLDIYSTIQWPVPQSVAKSVTNLYADQGVKEAIGAAVT